MCRARLGSKAAATARPGEPRPARTSGRALRDGSGSARARLGLSRSPQVPAGALSRPPSCTVRAQRPATRRVGGRVLSLTTSALPSPTAQHEEDRGDASSDVSLVVLNSEHADSTKICEETRPTARLVDLRFCPALPRCNSVKNCDQTRPMTRLIAILLCPALPRSTLRYHSPLHALSPGRLIQRDPRVFL